MGLSCKSTKDFFKFSAARRDDTPSPAVELLQHGMFWFSPPFEGDTAPLSMLESGRDEEYAALPEFHRLVIPEGCHWNDLRTITSNVGLKIECCLREIEPADQECLYGIFGDAQWSNGEKLLDSAMKTRLLCMRFFINNLLALTSAVCNYFSRQQKVPDHRQAIWDS